MNLTFKKRLKDTKDLEKIDKEFNKKLPKKYKGKWDSGFYRGYRYYYFDNVKDFSVKGYRKLKTK